MNDINFFEDYVCKRKLRINNIYILSLLTGTVCLLIMMYAVSNEMKIRRLSSQVSLLKTRVEDPSTVKKVKDIKAREDEISNYRVEVDKMKILSKSIEGERIVDNDLLGMIFHSMPNSMFLKAINISQGEVHIVGISQDKLSVAEFSKGISYIDKVDQVFISNISQEEENYNFDLNITLRDVIENEKEQ